MDRYIKQNDAVNVIALEPLEHCPKWYADKIEKLPAEDVVPVVRCRDCKYSGLPSTFIQIYGVPGTLTCKNSGTPCNKRNVASNDFCSYGKRKKED